MTQVTFIGIDGDITKSGPFDGHRLHLIIKHRGCAMGIDKSKRRLGTIIDNSSEGTICALAILDGITDMRGIIPDSSRSCGPHGAGLSLTREDHRGSGLPKVQSMALHIKRTTGLWGKSLQRLEAGNDETTRTISPADNGMFILSTLKQA